MTMHGHVVDRRDGWSCYDYELAARNGKSLRMAACSIFDPSLCMVIAL